MPKAFAKFVPTTDPACVSRGIERHDVQIFRDESCTDPMARFMWYNNSKPNSRTVAAKINGVMTEIFWA